MPANDYSEYDPMPSEDLLDEVAQSIAGAGIYWHWNDSGRATFVCCIPGAAVRDLFKLLEEAGI